MRATSRREFFKNFFNSTVESISKSEVGSVVQKVLLKKESKNSEVSEKVVLGKLSDFPPGSKKEVLNSLGLPITVISNEIGIYCFLNDPSQRKSVQILRTGELLADCAKSWPDHAILSPMTGEQVSEKFSNKTEESNT